VRIDLSGKGGPEAQVMAAARARASAVARPLSATAVRRPSATPVTKDGIGDGRQVMAVFARKRRWGEYDGLVARQLAQLGEGHFGEFMAAPKS